jgi:hypothetical protein
MEKHAGLQKTGTTPAISSSGGRDGDEDGARTGADGDGARTGTRRTARGRRRRAGEEDGGAHADGDGARTGKDGGARSGTAARQR